MSGRAWWQAWLAKKLQESMGPPDPVAETLHRAWVRSEEADARNDLAEAARRRNHQTPYVPTSYQTGWNR